MTSIRRVAETADLIALVPHLVGLTTDDSIVLVPFAGRRSQGALRVDRQLASSPEQAMTRARHLVGIVCNLDSVDSLFPVVTTPAPLAEAEHDRLMVAALVLAARAAGFHVGDAALVGADGWVSVEEPHRHPLPARPAGLPALANPATEAALPDRDPATAAHMDQQRHDARLVAAAAFHAFDPTDRIEAALTSTTPSALLATLAAVPALRDLVLLQAGWGHDFGRHVWRRTVLDPAPLAPDEETALAYRGGNFRRPNPDRLTTATTALRATIPGAEPVERTGITAMIAWLHWARGSSTIAARLAATALATDPGHGLAFIIRILTDAGTLPEWAYRAQPLL